ncbi:MAG: phosphotransferase [Burkholderiales bacterium]|nr:phosphotransferase [Burkholderiales bacterium]
MDHRVRCVLLTNAPVAGLAQEERQLFESIVVVAKAQMAERLAAMPPGPVVVDTAVIPRLALLADPLCLVLRETVAHRLPAFRLEAGRPWDLVVIPSPREHWRPDLAAIGARHVEHVNWIYRTVGRPSGDSALPSRTRPRVLVATGGGGTADTATGLRGAIDDVLYRLPEGNDRPEVVQVAGPRLAPEGFLQHAHVRIDVGARLNEAFAEADVVVSTVGYNSILELACHDTPALLVPIERTFDDQVARAEAWGPVLGLAHRADDVARSSAWIAAVLDTRQRRDRIDLGLSGAGAAAELIVTLARSRAGWSFDKPMMNRGRPAPSAAAHRATALFMQGVATPCARDGLSPGSITMPRLGGSTLRNRLRTMGGPFASGPSMARAVRDVLRGDQDGTQLLAMFRSVEEVPQGVARFDPLAKVRPRLHRGNGATHPASSHLRRAAALADRIEQTLQGALGDHGNHVLIHGDLHAGQILTGAGGPIIIDLDDLAMGAAEADIANLGAHLVTSADLYVGSIAPGFLDVIGVLAELMDGDRLSPTRLALYGAAALLRRALKVGEREGDTDRSIAIIGASEILLRLAISAARSSPPDDGVRSRAASPAALTP